MKDYFLHIIDYVQNRRWLEHVLFWLTIYLLQVLGLHSDFRYSDGEFLHKLIMLSTKIVVAYTFIYYQVPKLLYKKKYVLFIISIVITSYIFCVLDRLLVVYIVETLLRKGTFEQESVVEILLDIRKLYSTYFLSLYFPTLIFFTLKLIKEKFIETSQIEQLKREKSLAELNFLKAQIHPHFLFNTLNNLYVLTLQKSKKAPETVLKLSQILDYMLYQCNDKHVTIEKELELIQNYIDLEKLRYGERLELKLNKNIDNPQTKIAPLILVSIIENAFKHGISSTIDKTIVKIDFKVQNKTLNFNVFNTKSKLVQKDNTKYRDGIGQKNIEKQLKLIYPDKFQFKIHEEDISYTVKLNIDLS
ncbi:sensor histidine kinase [Flavivirga rizhaonensis]|uniref:Histidine kinase n=1 Tax=Flavivirga rizhaonensis TaxID=2559571 RepID=A0A4S1E287_9FLAO|nr:histidine kinase [Flavivirga rizhaonensis]TGV04727.1 histidine kinase [Flavivirga rizhaonensis]